jgi:uncharacterized protein
MPMPEIPNLARMSLDDIAAAVEAQHLPPVDDWHPAHSGESFMRIAADGTWFHEGSPINRVNMVRLFSTILRREADGSYVLVTPAEKLRIEVEDTPFIAVEVKSEGTQEARQLGGDDPRPDLMVRGGMEARIARAAWVELAGWAVDEGCEPPGLWSGGAFFSLVSA